MIKQMAKIHYYIVACPSTPAQHAVLEGLRGPQTYLEEMVAEFQRRRDLIVGLLNKIPGFKCLKPKGAFYAFPSFSLPMSSEELALDILKAGVICTPGSAFGRAGEGHLRFSYANSQENIKRAMGIVADVVAGLPR
jgi:aspartate aminotransferase